MQHFNSIKVRLEQARGIRTFTESQFQFHKGTIRTGETPKKEREAIYFNSIKVRLELRVGEIPLVE